MNNENTYERPDTWTTISGDEIKIKDMSTAHLKNTVAMAEDAIDDHPSSISIAIMYHALCDELDTRWVGRGKKIKPRLRVETIIGNQRITK